MTVSVVVPYRPNCPEREAAWGWLRPQWEARGYEIIEATDGDGPWRKGVAVTEGVRRATGDTVVIADADVWCNGMVTAVTALSDARWVVPHGRTIRLDETSTERLIRGISGPVGYTRPPYVGKAGGGLVVIRRDDYLKVPIDPRFEGWGHEDEAWGLALACLLGPPWRGEAPLWHLWHPPEPRTEGRKPLGSIANQNLWRRYIRAQGTRTARMQTIIDEVTDASDRQVHTEPRRHPSATHLPGGDR